VSVLVLATFSLVVVLALQQRRATAERQVKQALEARLDREMEKELQRLSRPALGMPGARPRGAARVEQAIDNVLARSFDQMLALEHRRESLRRALRQRPGAAQRRRLERQLQQVGKELEVAKLWVLMLEDRRMTARKLDKPPDDDGEPPKTPGASPSRSSVPRLPDWLSALQ
jgi:hypothetical protein